MARNPQQHRDHLRSWLAVRRSLQARPPVAPVAPSVAADYVRHGGGVGFTIDVQEIVEESGRRTLILEVNQTGCSPGDRWDSSSVMSAGATNAVGNMLRAGYVTFQCECTGGGPNVLPSLGKTAGFASASAQEVYSAPVEGPYVALDTPTPFRFAIDQDGIIYGDPGFETGSNNAAYWLITLEQA